MTTLVRNAFGIVAAMLIAVLLYQVLYGSENSALATMSRAMRTPLSKYYYEYVYVPAQLGTEGVAEQLGYSITHGLTDLDSGIPVDTADTASQYSTGWF